MAPDDPIQPQRHSIRLAWGEVSFLRWEPPAPHRPGGAPDVVLLHGGGVDSAWLSWGGLGLALARAGYRVTAPDHPGYGHSPVAPWASTHERLVAYVAEFVAALGIRDYTVGGLSLGGGMAIGHALASPGSVRAIILMGSYGLMDRQVEGLLSGPAHALSWLMVRTGLMGRTLRWFGRSSRRLERSVRPIIRNPAARTPDLVAAVVAEARREGAFVAFGEWQRDQITWGRTRTNYTDLLPTVRVPALVIHGKHDTGVPVARAWLAAEAIPDSRLLVVRGAGHWVQRDRPEIVTPAVVSFLHEVNGAGGVGEREG